MSKLGTDLASFYEGKSIIVTGGLGFIGSNLAIRLAELKAKVTLVDSLIPDYGGNIFNIDPIKKLVKINIADVRDEYSMNHLVKDHDIMFNLAGQVSHIDSMKNPYTDLEINTRSQLSILESCRKNNSDIKIIFASTRQIYGKPQYLPVDEEHPLNPTDVNGVNKIAGEQYHILYHNVYGLRTVSLRLTNTYGPRLLVKHNRQGFLGWFLRLLIEGKEITIFGDGKQLRDLNYIDDVVDALLLSACTDKANGESLNLGDSNPVSLLDIVEMMIKVNGCGRYKLVPFPEDQKKIDIGHYYSTFRKAKDILGWEPKVDLEEGLLQTVEFYKKYGEKYYWK